MPTPSSGSPASRTLPEDEQDVLATLARTDPDARVRRAAVSKLGTVAVLTEVVRQDADAEVRDEAAGVLLDIALGAYEASEAVSLAAVEGLVGLPAAEAQKQLVLVAKTARREAVARRALEALGDDARAIGTTARAIRAPGDPSRGTVPVVRPAGTRHDRAQDRSQGCCAGRARARRRRRRASDDCRAREERRGAAARPWARPGG